MAATTLTERARRGVYGRGAGRAESPLGHPLAFLATALVLLALFGWTFVANPERVAPTKDPAYYTWRTETLISEDPATLMEIRGAFDMFAGGYRVAAPVIGGFLRRVAGVSSLHTTSLLMVAAPVLTSLLLAGFAYRQRRDPLLWHTVAFGTASLYLTPPFVGYLDNVLCLMFLAAAVWFLGETRASWGARTALFVFLALAGFTHPTTLVIFCVFLGSVSLVRLFVHRFDVVTVARADGWTLATAFAAVVFTYAVWTAGIWGVPASLSEAALPPPYGVDFFVERLLQWVDAMRPALNGPLLAVGLIGLLAAGRRAADDQLALVSIVWLAPLAGLFGFLAGIAYPYYRFFNTTLGWVLLVGVGAYFLVRLFTVVARRGGIARLALVGVVAVAWILATNLQAGFEQAGWNDPSKGWLSSQTRADLDALRAALAGVNRPVVFVIDDEDASFQIWGFAKLSGNTSRYGLPHGEIDRGYLYLGSLDNLLAGRATERSEETYDKLSVELLEDAQRGFERAGASPLVVVASAFNSTGANAEIAAGDRTPPPPEGVAALWLVHDGEVTEVPGEESLLATPVRGESPEPDAGVLARALVLGALALLVLPGALLFRWACPRAGLAEALGMAPALAAALIALVGIAALAVARAPFSPGLAWISWALAVVLGAVAAVSARRSPA